MYLVIDLLQLFVLLQCHCLIVSFFIYRVYHVYRVFQLRLIHMFHINRRNNSSQSIILTNWLQLMCTQSSHSHIHICYVITGWNFRHFFQLYRDLYHIKHLWLLVTTHSLTLSTLHSFFYPILLHSWQLSCSPLPLNTIYHHHSLSFSLPQLSC